MEIRDAKLYTIPEVCEILGVERHTVYRYINEGRIKSIATKKWDHRRVFGKFIKQFMESN